MNKILIIEDDADINVIIAEALTKAGYSCTQRFREQKLCFIWTKRITHLLLWI